MTKILNAILHSLKFLFRKRVKYYCNSCGKDITKETQYATPNGRECEECKNISIEEYYK